MNFMERSLAELKELGLRRHLRLNEGTAWNFSTNDYLSLSKHPRVIHRAIQAVEIFGAGSGGSRLMTGNLSIHEELEKKLAGLVGMESALVYGSGFLANTGVLKAIAGRSDLIFADRLNHASLVDGATGSGAMVWRYLHCDTSHLSDMLSKHTTCGRRIIVTDSLFSMDGDIAPLAELSELAEKHNCMLMVDEAHATGVFGGGAGLCAELGIRPDILTGTLSKALGSYGGYAASSSAVREFLINRSRSFIYSTGLPPASVGAALGAMEVLEREPELGRQVLNSAGFFRKGLAALGLFTGASDSQIVPLYAGDPSMATALSTALEKAGVLALAVRPPTVPEGTSRLRFSITLAHSQEIIEETLWKIKKTA